MTDEPPEPSPLGDEPFAGFDLQVMTDRPVYAAGDTVRITVTAANQGPRFVEHHYPGWQRFLVTVRDDHHRPVADDELDRPAAQVAIDRFLPGQIVIWPIYWNQQTGPLVPAWADDPPGPRAAPGRYRIRVSWLGREPGVRGQPADAWSSPFELV